MPIAKPIVQFIIEEKLTIRDIYEDAHKSQASDWNFLSKQLFGSNAPDSSSWKDINKIVDILNVIGRTPAYNHMLFHDKGGLDFSHAEFAAETGCIKMYDTIGFCYIVKPKRLYFEGFGNDFRWNYFLLELAELTPILENNDSEYLVEDSPAHYVSARYRSYIRSALLEILVLADFGILILIDSCCKLNEGTLSMCNDLADLGNNIVSVIALYTASIPVIYNSYDYNNNIENYDEYFRYKRKKYRTDATFSNINGFILEIGICILAFIVALKGYNFFQKYRRKRSALREFLNKDNMKTVLVIMAAGISSRFGGGIKQLAPVGLNGEIIMDYSIHDAIEAGFNKIVFIIRKDIKDAFKEAIGDRIEKI